MCTNIPPLYDSESRVLLLGSIPSPKSREAGFFYAHPQNRFWRVLSAVLDEELPALEGALSPDAVRQALGVRGCQMEKLLSLHPAKHIFTHVEWRMTGYYVELAEPPAELTFVTPSALREEYALPSAFRPFLTVLEDEE